MNNTFIIISGLPASGKSTIGSALSQELGLPFLDKDIFLEDLFKLKGVGDAFWRQKLSRESDTLFQQKALQVESAILVSHWRPLKSQLSSGTPTNWLVHSGRRIIEVFCHCSNEVAIQRFILRKRHPGHLDASRKIEDLTLEFEIFADQLPLDIGHLVKISTEQDFEINDLTKHLKTL